MQTATVHGRRVEYVELNPTAAKPTLVMLHGFRGSSDGVLDTARLLRDFRVLVPNLPGTAGSQPLRAAHSVPNLCRWLDEFLQTTGLERYALWGHSFGGALALAHAALGRREPTATVAVCPALPSGGLQSVVPTAYFGVGRLLPPRLRARWIASRVVNRASGWALIRDRPRRAELIQRGLATLTELDPETVIDQFLSTKAYRLEAERIETPVLVVGGTRDTLVPREALESLTDTVPEGRLALLPGAGHLVPLEDPEAVAGLTRDFLLGTADRLR
jgi:pimeloyl-ACP methyl ester carboxylesterase